MVEVEEKWTMSGDTYDKEPWRRTEHEGVREWEAARLTPGIWTE